MGHAHKGGAEFAGQENDGQKCSQSVMLVKLKLDHNYR